MWYLLLLALGLGVLMFPFILYWETGFPLIISAPLWYFIIPFAIIRWFSKRGERKREAFGKHLLPEEEGVVSVTGKYLYKNFLEDCAKCCMFADGSVHVVVRACGERGEWLKSDTYAKYFAFELAYNGFGNISALNGRYEHYRDERHTDAKSDLVAVRIIHPQYLLTDNKTASNTERVLRYFVFLTNQYMDNSATDETCSFLRGHNITFYDKEVSSMFQFFLNYK